MGNTHKQAIDSSAADKHVNNGSVRIGKRAYTHTHTHTQSGEKSAENTSFLSGDFWVFILNRTLNVVSGGLIHYNLKINFPTGYTSSDHAKDTLSVHRRLQTITLNTHVRELQVLGSPLTNAERSTYKILVENHLRKCPLREPRIQDSI